MNVGLLAFHYAVNFGAALQLLSTYRFLLGKNLCPIIINWVPSDAEEFYKRRSPAPVWEFWKGMRSSLWRETRLCRTSEDVAKVIEEEGIEAVIIGSDAVCQCHTLAERTVFPCRTIIGITGVLSYAEFPNAFWADWNGLLKQPLPVAVISASSQDSKYSYFKGAMRKAMENCILDYAYLSVRDEWTREMMVHITRGLCSPDVTPDPVFAFSQNAGDVLPPKEEIFRRFNLPDKYILMTFSGSRTVSQQWIDRFAECAKERDGAEVIMLPFANKRSFGSTTREIPLPLSPVDWYSLIKYSSGYTGHNMHPIVVSLHNNVPFFSFDNYGLKRFNGLFPTDKSSKIKHILTLAGLETNRVSCISKRFKAPKPEEVYARLRETDREKERSFAARYLAEYNKMMADVLSAILS